MLDIDGVLNSIQSELYYLRLEKEFGIKRIYGNFCPIAASNLKVILNNISDMKIVISSTWRKGKAQRETLQENFKKYNLPWDKVIGYTPVHNDGIRGNEIQAWLDNHPAEQVDDFVIIDDDSDMVHLMPKLVKTDNRIGLSWKEVEIIVNRFTGKEPDLIWDSSLKD